MREKIDVAGDIFVPRPWNSVVVGLFSDKILLVVFKTIGISCHFLLPVVLAV